MAIKCDNCDATMQDRGFTGLVFTPTGTRGESSARIWVEVSGCQSDRLVTEDEGIELCEDCTAAYLIDELREHRQFLKSEDVEPPTTEPANRPG